MGKKYSFFSKSYWQNWAATCKRMKLEHSLTHMQITSRWIKDLNLGLDSIKLWEESIGRTLWHKLQQYFLDLSAKAEETVDFYSDIKKNEVLTFAAIVDGLRGY